MVAKKHKSNRLKARDKYKIQFKVREHARKTRKLSKSNPKKKKIINHIPNDFPFKDELLAQAQTLKQVKSLQPKPVPTMPVTPVEAKQELKLRPKIYELYKHTVSQSDLLIQVLDGRDPMFSRSLELEQIVMKKNLIIVLTRADLIPVSILKGWISIFSKYCPVVPFGLTCGPEMSVQIINNYVLAQNATKVGIVGYPGVGKSTLVAYLSKFVELQSQNGIIFSKTTDSNESPSVLLRNYSKAAHVPDPEHALKHLVNKFGLDDLCQYFNVAYSSTMNDFLMQIARRQGFIRKHGVLDLVSGARYVLQEYYDGRILFCSEPTPLFPLNKSKFKPVNMDELLKQFGTKEECLISKSSMPVPTDTDMQYLPFKYPSVPTEDEDVGLEPDSDLNEEDVEMQIIDEKFEFEEYYQKE